MKPRTLSKKQKNKLFDMIRHLYPEWSLHTYDHQFEDLPDSMFSINKPDEVPYKGLIIHHWFEFCMTHLVRAIINNKNYPSPNPIYDSTDALAEMITQQEWFTKKAYHPVDYLYTQFKKLKNEDKGKTKS